MDSVPWSTRGDCSKFLFAANLCGLILYTHQHFLPYFGYFTLLAFCVPVSDGFLKALNRLFHEKLSVK
jgi:hypothetical protein